MMMMSRWFIGIVTVGMLVVAAAASEIEDEEQKEPVTNTSEGVRTGRQYHSSRPSLLSRNPSHLVDYAKLDDSVVQYDPSGLGFEIQKPGVFQYQYRPGYHSEPVKPTAYVQTKPPYHEKSVYSYSPEPRKPVYPPRPAYHESAKPHHYPGYTGPKPSYKPDTPYPVGAAPYPENPNKYDDKYPYYCPKVGGYESQCRPAKDCAIWYDLVLSTPGSTCKLPDGEPGTCCPDLPYNSKWHFLI